jgi:hypothetical protein
MLWSPHLKIETPCIKLVLYPLSEFYTAFIEIYPKISWAFGNRRKDIRGHRPADPKEPISWFLVDFAHLPIPLDGRGRLSRSPSCWPGTIVHRPVITTWTILV